MSINPPYKKIKKSEVGRISFISRKKVNKKEKENKNKNNKGNYVQRTTLYNNHIDNQQINSSGKVYLLVF